MALIIAYVLIFSVIIYKSSYFSLTDFSKPIILLFFFIKLFAAFLYIHLHNKVLNGGDIVTFINESEILFSSLKESPRLFLQLALGHNDVIPEPIHLEYYIDKMGYWYDNANYLVVRINALIRLISDGNWYVNVVFFSFFSFVGVFGIFRFFSDYLEGNSQYILVIILFIVPSSVFWYSGLHKESIVIFSLGLILNSYRNFRLYRRKISSSFLIALGFLLLFLVRSYVFGAFIISFTALLLSKQFSLKPIYLFVLVFIGYAASVLLIGSINEKANPLNEMKVRQLHFLGAPGNTTYDVPILEPSLKSAVKNSPEAVLNIIRRPMVSDCMKSNFWCFLAMIESYIILICVLIGIYHLNWRALGNNSLFLFCLVFSLVTLLIIGLIVNNSGAMVRYKSIVIPFLLIGLILGRNTENSFK